MRAKQSLITATTLVLLLGGVLLVIRLPMPAVSVYARPLTAPGLCAQKESSSFSLDGVELHLCTFFLPASNFVTSDSDNAIQVATVINREGDFRELSITAVPFGTRPSTEALPRAHAQSEAIYRAEMRDYRERQGGNPQVGPVAHLFGKQVTSSISIVHLHIDGAIAKPVAIAEWVVEAGDRIWIVRTSEEVSSSNAATFADSLGSMELSSPDLSRPSTSVAAMNRPRRQVVDTSDSAPDLPFPSWWDGDCDKNNYAAATGINAYPLGASYRGVKACGPRPWADGAPDVPVAFFLGAEKQLEWQCPELTKRFMYLAYNIAPYSAHGSQVVWNCNVDTNGCWLEKISNGTPGKAPQPGDILSYGSTSTYGHTSVVAESNVDNDGNGTILVVEQNSSPDGDRVLAVTNWQVMGSSGTVSGWLHDPSSETQTPPTDLSITGLPTGLIHTRYIFTATVSPVTATIPITYVWQATGQVPITNTGGLSDTIAFTWDTTGAQVITLTVANDAGTVTDTRVISIYAPIQAAFNAAPLAGQPPLTVVFTDTSTGSLSTWLWDFGDGITGTVQHLTHTYHVTGAFAVSLTVSGLGGLDTVVKQRYIRVSEKPVIANFTAYPTRGTEPLTVQFTEASAGDVANWAWDFGDSVTSTRSSPSHTYTIAGAYTVTLVVSGSGSIDSETKAGYIDVQKKYDVYLPLVLRDYMPIQASFVASPLSGTAPLTVTFSNTSSGNYTASLWNFGDGAASTQTHPIHTYVTPGAYTVTLAISKTNGTPILPGDTSTLSLPDYITVHSPGSCVEGIVNGGFEDDSGWNLPTTAYPAGYTTAITHSGNRSMRVGIVELGDNRESYSSARQMVTIPSDAISATLHFWLYLLSGASSADVQYVMILDEDGQEVEMLISQRRDDRQWMSHQFDLTPYAGWTVELYFGVYNDGSDGVTAIYVDDVSLEICTENS